MTLKVLELLRLGRILGVWCSVKSVIVWLTDEDVSKWLVRGVGCIGLVLMGRLSYTVCDGACIGLLRGCSEVVCVWCESSLTLVLIWFLALTCT